jgi:hypothetical protein
MEKHTEKGSRNAWAKGLCLAHIDNVGHRYSEQGPFDYSGSAVALPYTMGVEMYDSSF